MQKLLFKPPLLILVVSFSLLISGCLPELAGPTGVSDSESLRQTPLGKVVGSVGVYGNHEWRGIPYAAAPTGDLRWRAPQPPEAWQGTRDALFDSPVCPQMGNPSIQSEGMEFGEPTGSEDCLYLNVFAPRRAPDQVPEGDQRWPVMVWFHGGSNIIGDVSRYHGGLLAERYGVVVVVVQYRLGPFGWFRHQALRAAASDATEASGNFGTLDLIQSLHYVQDNIASFGGNPDNVTIFGESAGGHNVMSLLVSPQARGLFHRAIAQSASTRLTTVDRAENSVEEGGHPYSSAEVAMRMLMESGEAEDREQAKAMLATLSMEQIEQRLRDLSSYAVLRLYDELDPATDALPRAFADGDVIPAEGVFAALAEGRYHQVPVLLGTNREEGKIWMMMGEEYINRRFGFYPTVKDWDVYDSHAQYSALIWKGVAVDEVARRIQGHGGNVYTYRFDWDEEPSLLGIDFSRVLGAAHLIDVFFVFGHFQIGPFGIIFFDDENEPGRLQLSDAMMSYWSNFAYTGTPARGRDRKLPEWPAWGEEAPQLMILDTVADEGLRVEAYSVSPESIVADVSADARFPDNKARCAFFQKQKRQYIESHHLAALGCYKGVGQGTVE